MKLHRILAAAAVALGTGFAAAAELDPPVVVGRLSYISGPVSFASAQSGEDWAAAALNRPLTGGDRLATGPNGRAELHVGSLAVRMAAQTGVDVLNLDERTLELRVSQGTMILRVRRLASDQLVEVVTPSASVVVKQPGAYRIDVDPSGPVTRVTVRAGGAADANAGGSGFAVRDGETVVMAGGREESFAAALPDEFDRWAGARDQREDSVASTRYVPQEMTGYEDLDQYGTWRTVEQYGPVWVPTYVPAGWAPYRFGRWVTIRPWGWTWVDDAPWGFAPFHYGRWVWLGRHWAWAPGHRFARPVYAPALVAFIGGPGFALAAGAGHAPAVGWVPLAWREPYRPWYRASDHHVRSVNVAHVTNATHGNGNFNHPHFANRNVPSGVTAMSREHFYESRRVQHAAFRVPDQALAAARVTGGAPEPIPHRRDLRRDDAPQLPQRPVSRERAQEQAALPQEAPRQQHEREREQQQAREERQAREQQRQQARDQVAREREAREREAQRRQQEHARAGERQQVPEPFAGRQRDMQQPLQQRAQQPVPQGEPPRQSAPQRAEPHAAPAPQPRPVASQPAQQRAQPVAQPPQRAQPPQAPRQQVQQQVREPARVQLQRSEPRDNGGRERQRARRPDRDYR